MELNGGYIMKIAVVGTGYVGLSNAVLLAQHHEVIALDIDEEKVKLINEKKSPISDPHIEAYLQEKDLQLRATTREEEAYNDVVYDIIASQTDYVSETN